MSYKQKLLKIVAATLVICFATADLSWAAPSLVSPLSALDSLAVDPHRLETPKSFAKLQEIHRGTNGSLVIHIQDAHSNLSGQKNLASTLNALMARYGLSLVLSEGGWGDCTLTQLRKIAGPGVWKQLASSYLVQGKISGEEYLNLTSDRPMKIVGIEDSALYLKSLQSYGDLAGKREAALNYLANARSAVERLKRRHYPGEILDYERRMEKGGQKVEELLDLARIKKIVLTGYPTLERLIELKELESRIDFNLANLEKAALAKGGEEGPHLQKYEDYLKFFSKIDLDGVIQETGALENAIYAASLADENAQLLRAIDRYLGLLETAYQIRMTTQEFATFQASEPDFGAVPMIGFLNRRLAEAGYADLIADENILEEGKASLEAFYGSVKQRDFAFVENTERAMRADNQKVAVLITGGYHTGHLKKLLAEKGYSIAVLTPVVTGETNQNLYEKRLLAPVTKKNHELRAGRGGSDASVSGVRTALLGLALSKFNQNPPADPQAQAHLSNLYRGEIADVRFLMAQAGKNADSHGVQKIKTVLDGHERALRTLSAARLANGSIDLLKIFKTAEQSSDDPGVFRRLADELRTRLSHSARSILDDNFRQGLNQRLSASSVLMHTAALYILETEVIREDSLKDSPHKRTLEILDAYEKLAQRLHESGDRLPGNAVEWLLQSLSFAEYDFSIVPKFIELRKRLALLPGKYRYDAVAYDLLLTGAHLTGEFIEEDIVDIERVLPSLRVALTALAGDMTDLPDESSKEQAKRKLYLGLLKFVLMMEPFLVDTDDLSVLDLSRFENYYKGGLQAVDRLGGTVEISEARRLIESNTEVISRALNRAMETPGSAHYLATLNFLLYSRAYEVLAKSGKEKGLFGFLEEYDRMDKEELGGYYVMAIEDQSYLWNLLETAHPEWIRDAEAQLKRLPALLAELKSSGGARLANGSVEPEVLAKEILTKDPRALTETDYEKLAGAASQVVLYASYQSGFNSSVLASEEVPGSVFERKLDELKIIFDEMSKYPELYDLFLTLTRLAARTLNVVAHKKSHAERKRLYEKALKLMEVVAPRMPKDEGVQVEYATALYHAGGSENNTRTLEVLDSIESNAVSYESRAAGAARAVVLMRFARDSIRGSYGEGRYGQAVEMYQQALKFIETAEEILLANVKRYRLGDHVNIGQVPRSFLYLSELARTRAEINLQALSHSTEEGMDRMGDYEKSISSDAVDTFYYAIEGFRTDSSNERAKPVLLAAVDFLVGHLRVISPEDWKTAKAAEIERQMTRLLKTIEQNNFGDQEIKRAITGELKQEILRLSAAVELHRRTREAVKGSITDIIDREFDNVLIFNNAVVDTAEKKLPAEDKVLVRSFARNILNELRVDETDVGVAKAFHISDHKTAEDVAQYAEAEGLSIAKNEIERVISSRPLFRFLALELTQPSAPPDKPSNGNERTTENYTKGAVKNIFEIEDPSILRVLEALMREVLPWVDEEKARASLQARMESLKASVAEFKQTGGVELTNRDRGTSKLSSLTDLREGSGKIVGYRKEAEKLKNELETIRNKILTRIRARINEVTDKKNQDILLNGKFNFSWLATAQQEWDTIGQEMEKLVSTTSNGDYLSRDLFEALTSRIEALYLRTAPLREKENALSSVIASLSAFKKRAEALKTRAGDAVAQGAMDEYARVAERFENAALSQSYEVKRADVEAEVAMLGQKMDEMEALLDRAEKVVGRIRTATLQYSAVSGAFSYLAQHDLTINERLQSAVEILKNTVGTNRSFSDTVFFRSALDTAIPPVETLLSSVEEQLKEMRSAKNKAIAKELEGVDKSIQWVKTWLFTEIVPRHMASSDEEETVLADRFKAHEAVYLRIRENLLADEYEPHKKSEDFTAIKGTILQLTEAIVRYLILEKDAVIESAAKTIRERKESWALEAREARIEVVVYYELLNGYPVSILYRVEKASSSTRSSARSQTMAEKELQALLQTVPHLAKPSAFSKYHDYEGLGPFPFGLFLTAAHLSFQRYLLLVDSPEPVEGALRILRVGGADYFESLSETKDVPTNVKAKAILVLEALMISENRETALLRPLAGALAGVDKENRLHLTAPYFDFIRRLFVYWSKSPQFSPTPEMLRQHANELLDREPAANRIDRKLVLAMLDIILADNYASSKVPDISIDVSRLAEAASGKPQELSPAQYDIRVEILQAAIETVVGARLANGSVEHEDPQAVAEEISRKDPRFLTERDYERLAAAASQMVLFARYQPGFSQVVGQASQPVFEMSSEDLETFLNETSKHPEAYEIVLTLIHLAGRALSVVAHEKPRGQRRRLYKKALNLIESVAIRRLDDAVTQVEYATALYHVGGHENNVHALEVIEQNTKRDHDYENRVGNAARAVVLMRFARDVISGLYIDALDRGRYGEALAMRRQALSYITAAETSLLSNVKAYRSGHGGKSQISRSFIYLSNLSRMRAKMSMQFMAHSSNGGMERVADYEKSVFKEAVLAFYYAVEAHKVDLSNTRVKPALLGDEFEAIGAVDFLTSELKKIVPQNWNSTEVEDVERQLSRVVETVDLVDFTDLEVKTAIDDKLKQEISRLVAAVNLYHTTERALKESLAKNADSQFEGADGFRKAIVASAVASFEKEREGLVRSFAERIIGELDVDEMDIRMARVYVLSDKKTAKKVTEYAGLDDLITTEEEIEERISSGPLFRFLGWELERPLVAAKDPDNPTKRKSPDYDKREVGNIIKTMDPSLSRNLELLMGQALPWVDEAEHRAALTRKFEAISDEIVGFQTDAEAVLKRKDKCLDELSTLTDRREGSGTSVGYRPEAEKLKDELETIVSKARAQINSGMNEVSRKKNEILLLAGKFNFNWLTSAHHELKEINDEIGKLVTPASNGDYLSRELFEKLVLRAETLYLEMAPFKAKEKMLDPVNASLMALKKRAEALRARAGDGIADEALDEHAHAAERFENAAFSRSYEANRADIENDLLILDHQMDEMEALMADAEDLRAKIIVVNRRFLEVSQAFPENITEEILVKDLIHSANENLEASLKANIYFSDPAAFRDAIAKSTSFIKAKITDSEKHITPIKKAKIAAIVKGFGDANKAIQLVKTWLFTEIVPKHTASTDEEEKILADKFSEYDTLYRRALDRLAAADPGLIKKDETFKEMQVVVNSLAGAIARYIGLEEFAEFQKVEGLIEETRAIWGSLNGPPPALLIERELLTRTPRRIAVKPGGPNGTSRASEILRKYPLIETPKAFEKYLDYKGLGPFLYPPLLTVALFLFQDYLKLIDEPAPVLENLERIRMTTTDYIKYAKEHRKIPEDAESQILNAVKVLLTSESRETTLLRPLASELLDVHEDHRLSVVKTYFKLVYEALLYLKENRNRETSTEVLWDQLMSHLEKNDEFRLVDPKLFRQLFNTFTPESVLTEDFLGLGSEAQIFVEISSGHRRNFSTVEYDTRLENLQLAIQTVVGELSETTPKGARLADSSIDLLEIFKTAEQSLDKPEVFRGLEDKLRTHLSDSARSILDENFFRGVYLKLPSPNKFRFMHTAALYILETEVMMKDPSKDNASDRLLKILDAYEGLAQSLHESQDQWPGDAVEWLLQSLSFAEYIGQAEDKFIELRSRLHLLPGKYGYDAVAYDLFLTGAHLRGEFAASDVVDIRRVLHNLDFALGALTHGIPESDIPDELQIEAKRKLQLGLLKFVIIMTPFLLDTNDSISGESIDLAGDLGISIEDFNYLARTSEMREIKRLLKKNVNVISEAQNRALETPESLKYLISVRFLLYSYIYGGMVNSGRGEGLFRFLERYDTIDTEELDDYFSLNSLTKNFSWRELKTNHPGIVRAAEAQLERLPALLAKLQSPVGPAPAGARLADDSIDLLEMFKTAEESLDDPEVFKRLELELRADLSPSARSILNDTFDPGFIRKLSMGSEFRFMHTAALYILETEVMREGPSKDDANERRLLEILDGYESLAQSLHASGDEFASGAVEWLLQSLSFSVYRGHAENTFIELRSRLHLLPGQYRYDAVAYDLLLTGAHLRRKFAINDEVDITRILPNLKFALGVLTHGIPESDILDEQLRMEAKRKLQLGLLKFVITMEPFLLDMNDSISVESIDLARNLGISEGEFNYLAESSSILKMKQLLKENVDVISEALTRVMETTESAKYLTALQFFLYSAAYAKMVQSGWGEGLFSFLERYDTIESEELDDYFSMDFGTKNYSWREQKTNHPSVVRNAETQLERLLALLAKLQSPVGPAPSGARLVQDSLESTTEIHPETASLLAKTLKLNPRLVGRNKRFAILDSGKEGTPSNVLAAFTDNNRVDLFHGNKKDPDRKPRYLGTLNLKEAREVPKSSPEALETFAQDIRSEQVATVAWKRARQAGMDNTGPLTLRIVTERQLKDKVKADYDKKRARLQKITGRSVSLEFIFRKDGSFVLDGPGASIEAPAVHILELSKEALEYAKKREAGVVAFDRLSEDDDGKTPVISIGDFVFAAMADSDFTDGHEQLFRHVREDGSSELTKEIYDTRIRRADTNPANYTRIKLKAIAKLAWAKFLEYTQLTLQTVNTAA